MAMVGSAVGVEAGVAMGDAVGRGLGLGPSGGAVGAVVGFELPLTAMSPDVGSSVADPIAEQPVNVTASATEVIEVRRARIIYASIRMAVQALDLI